MSSDNYAWLRRSVALTWNVLVEENGSTCNVTVAQSMRPDYTTSKSTHIKEMYLVGEAATGTLKGS